MYSIRRIRAGEWQALCDLRLRALRSDPDSFGSSYEREVGRPAEAWEKWAAESSTGQKQCLVVAESDGVFGGMAGAYTPEDSPNSRHLIGMWVAPEARANGIGAALVDEVLARGIRGGVEGISLWVVQSNQVARRLYQRAGFTETGEVQPLPSNPSLSETFMTVRLV